MEQTINCPKETCNGVLKEGIKGFYKCTVCGAKLKSSLVHKMAGITITRKMPEQDPVTHKFVASPKPAPEATSAVPEPPKEKVSIPKPPKEKKVPAKVKTEDGITLVGKTAVIHCIDCGAERMIKTQDIFQVKRCVTCQATYAKKMRAERAKLARAKKEVEQEG